MSVFKNISGSGSPLDSNPEGENGPPEELPTILIVDDEPDNIRSLIRLLEKKYQVLHAASGPDGIRVLREMDDPARVQLIITDQRMPGMKGTEFLVDTLQLAPHAIRIILSAYTDVRELMDSINQADVFKYLTKPIEPENFQLTVQLALEKYHLEERNRYLLKELREMILYLENKVAERTRELERIAITDPLTGLYNRRHILERLTEAMAAARRHGRPLSVLLIDIDHFKNINDTWGHQTGDEVLVGVAQELRANMREVDLVGRYGGEEFLMFFPETDMAAAREVGRRLARNLAQMEWTRPEIKITFSGGLVLYDGKEEINQFIHRADELLYNAKENGRDQIRSEEDPGE